MLRALLKKQFLQTFAFYFYNKKKSKRRSVGAVISVMALMAFALGCLALAFGFISYELGAVLFAAKLDWFYFVLVTLLATVLGVFGSVFSTATGLYQAKDNDLLLSLPLPPSYILFSRMISIYAVAFLYEGVVLIPAVAVYFIFAKPTVLAIVFSVLLIFIDVLFSLFLSCILGFLVALISSRMKNKSAVSTVLSLLFIVVYYIVYFNINKILTYITANAVNLADSFKNKAYPIYAWGTASTGNAVSFAVTVIIVIGLFAAAYYILSKTFNTIASKTENAEVSTSRKAVKSVRSSVESALLKKEFLHFGSSANYMLNCALGTVIMPVAGVSFIIFRERILNTVFAVGIPNSVLSVLVTALIFLASSMNDMTSPSVSLEGKNLWVLQSLPVEPSKVLFAKMRMHRIITVPPALIMVLCSAYVLKLSPYTTLFMVLAVYGFVCVMSGAGLIANLFFYDLTWVNDVVPIKQGLSVVITMFGGWAIAIIFGVAGYFSAKVIEPDTVLVIFAVINILASRLINRWIFTNGAKRFSEI